MDHLVLTFIGQNAVSILHIVFPLAFVRDTILLSLLPTTIPLVFFKLAFISTKRLCKFAHPIKLAYLEISNILKV